MFLKATTDREDKYLIYKINNFHFKDDPDYVFKTSHEIAQILVHMDQEGPDNLLQSEKAYFGGSHA